MFDLNELNEDFTSKAENLNRAKMSLFDASEKVISAKIELEDAEAELTIQGVEGKNAEERKANMYIKTEVRRGALELAEEKERAARLYLDTAQLNFDLCRYRLRIAELAAKESE